MSRTHDIIGLRFEAKQFLNENALKTEVKTCPTCKTTSGGEFQREKYDSFCGDVFAADFLSPHEDTCREPLWEYTLKDGRKVQEIVQAEPWNSGPNTFLCLRDSQTGEHLFEWSNEEMGI